MNSFAVLPTRLLSIPGWSMEIMASFDRVIRRSFARAVLRTEMWAGNRERWLHMLRPSHPIRWAWSTWRRRRREFGERLGLSEYTHLVVLRLRRPREAARLLRQLRRACGARKPGILTGFGAAP